MLFPSDFPDLTGVEDPQIAPDGTAVLFVRARFNLAENRTERSIARVKLGDYPQPFTRGITDRGPRWSPNAKRIAFLRKDDQQKTWVYAIGTDGGEPVALAGPFSRVAAPAWSPDGSSLAFAAAVAGEPADTTVAFDEKSGARHIVALPYKTDLAGLSDGKRMQIHVVGPDGAARLVAGGPFDALHPAWSRDGRRLVFVANPGVPEGSFASDLYAVGAGGGELERLTTMNCGFFGPPAFSRDGTQIAFIANDTLDFGGRRNPQLWCVDATGGTPRSLTPARAHYLGDAIASDLRAHDHIAPFWLPGDAEIVVQRSHEGACVLSAFARDGSTVRDIVGGERAVYAYSGAPDGALAFAATDPVEPGDVYLWREGFEMRVTEENLPWIDRHPPVAPQRIRPRAPDGSVLDAWIIDAVEPTRNSPPLVHAIHGGPHAAYGFAFFFEFQMLAAHGMTVVYGNPRGSQSYGEQYADAITGRWGELDAGDLLAIRDAALEAREVDRKRVAVQGGSYGGLMTTWLLGHDGGYACGVSMRAVNDYLSFAGVSDIPNFIERETASNWDDDGRRLFELSPIRGAARIEAPLLIMHSERDLRCPIDQGEQLFGRLRLLGKTAEFVRFTTDNHDLSRDGTPRNRLLRYRALLHWLRRYLGLGRRGKTAPGWLFAPLPGEEEAADRREGSGPRSLGLLAEARKV